MATALGLYIGSRIRAAREEADLNTQQALADLLPSPISNQYISKWERGVKPEDENLALIAAALGKDVAWFYEGFQRNGETPDLSSAAVNGNAAQLDRIEAKLDRLLSAAGLSAPEEPPEGGAAPPSRLPPGPRPPGEPPIEGTPPEPETGEEAGDSDIG